VKNNAYGLGFSVAGPIIDSFAEVSHLAVVRAEEAFALRKKRLAPAGIALRSLTPRGLWSLTPRELSRGS
jgi:alanine racemase